MARLGQAGQGARQWLLRWQVLWLCLVTAMLAVGVKSTAAAVTGGSILGMVQRHGQAIPEHRIMLIRFGPGDEVQRTPGQTDADGHFVFENLEPGESFEYVVGIRYEGQLYRSESVRLVAGEKRTNVVLEVKASAKPPAEGQVVAAPLQIANQLMVVVFRHDHLEIREIVELRNQGETPYVGTTPAGEEYSLSLPLPQGYYNLTDIQGLTPGQVRLHASGLYYTAPLSPGEHRILFTYAVPLIQRVTTLLTARTLPTTTLDVLVEDVHLVASSNLSPGGQVAIEPHTFWHFQGVHLDPQARFWLQVTQRTASVTLLQIIANGLVLGLALLGIGGPVYSAWCHRQPPASVVVITPEHLQRLQDTRVRLLQTIARLDDQYSAGGLPEPVYQQRRQTYKAQLLTVVSQLQYAQGTKESRQP